MIMSLIKLFEKIYIFTEKMKFMDITTNKIGSAGYGK